MPAGSKNSKETGCDEEAHMELFTLSESVDSMFAFGRRELILSGDSSIWSCGEERERAKPGKPSVFLCSRPWPDYLFFFFSGHNGDRPRWLA